MKTLLDENTRLAFLNALEKKIGKKLLFIDLDGVVADFDKGVEKWSSDLGITPQEFKDRKLYRRERFYYDLDLIPGAKEAIMELSSKYEIAFVSAPSWNNPHSFTEKRLWIEEVFGDWSKKRMDLSFRKGNYIGHYLVDDRTKYGAGDFIGEHIMFGKDPFRDWGAVKEYLLLPVNQ